MKFIKNFHALTYLLVFIATFYVSGCVRSGDLSDTNRSPEPPPTAEIDAACRQYLATVHYIKAVRGITLHRQDDTYFIAGADVDTIGGKAEIYNLIVRKFDDRGRKYWKAEDLSRTLVDTLSPGEKK